MRRLAAILTLTMCASLLHANMIVSGQRRQSAAAPPPAPADVTNGLVRWWTFQSTNSTGGFPTRTGYGTDVDWTNGGMTWTSASNVISSDGGAVGALFRTLDTELQFANSTTDRQFSIGAWINVALAGGGWRIMDRDGYYLGGARCWNFCLQSGKPTIYMFSDGANYFYIESTNVLASNTWYHVAVSYMPGASPERFGVAMYVNGISNGSTTAEGGNYSSLNLNSPLYTFLGRSGGAYAPAGHEGDLRVYNRALSAGEWRTVFSNGPPPVTYQ